MRPETIIAAVAAAFDVTADDLVSQDRRQHVTIARQAAAAVLHARLPDLALTTIGQLLGGRHHTTILHALDVVATRRQREASFDRILRTLISSEEEVCPPSETHSRTCGALRRHRAARGAAACKRAAGGSTSGSWALRPVCA
jgi:hypothetical protein